MGNPGEKRWPLWVGRVLSGLAIFNLVASAIAKFAQPAPVIETLVTKLGFSIESTSKLGVLEILCAILYAVPQTSVFGAILVSAYLGGAVAAHVRVGDNFVGAVILGIVVWVGLYLREPRLRAVIPVRRASP
jgi:hypothetical protein